MLFADLITANLNAYNFISSIQYIHGRLTSDQRPWKTYVEMVFLNSWNFKADTDDQQPRFSDWELRRPSIMIRVHQTTLGSWLKWLNDTKQNWLVHRVMFRYMLIWMAGFKLHGADTINHEKFQNASSSFVNFSLQDIYSWSSLDTLDVTLNPLTHSITPWLGTGHVFDMAVNTLP